jgi:predicted CopG family antitoxin
METITIPKDEYNNLKRIAEAYKQIAGNIFRNISEDSIENVVNDFKNTDLYSEEFLIDLQAGLEKSSYFTNK